MSYNNKQRVVYLNYMFRSGLIQQTKIADMSVIVHHLKKCWLKIKEEMPCEIVTWICGSFGQGMQSETH